MTTLDNLKKATESFVQGGMIILLTFNTTKALANNVNPDIKKFHAIEAPTTDNLIKEQTIALADSLLPKERKTLNNTFETLARDSSSRSIESTQLSETLHLNLPADSRITLKSVKGSRLMIATHIPIKIDDKIWGDSSNIHLRDAFTPIAELHPEKKEITITGKRIEKLLSKKNGDSYYSPSDPLSYLVSIPDNIKIVMYNGKPYIIGKEFKESQSSITINSLSHDGSSKKEKIATENTKERMTYTLTENREKNDIIPNKIEELRKNSKKTESNDNPILIAGKKIYLYQDILDAITKDNSLPMSTKTEMIKHFGVEYINFQKAKRGEKIEETTETGSFDDKLIEISTVSRDNSLSLDGISGTIFRNNYSILIKDFQTGVLTQEEVEGIIKTLSSKKKEFR